MSSHHPGARTAAPAHRLRAVAVTDASAILAAFAGAPDMGRQGAVTTLAEAEEMATWLSAPPRRGTAIVDATSDRLLDVVGVAVDEENLSGWFFYWLHADPRGQGLASRAAGFVQEGVERAKFLIDGERHDVLTCACLSTDPAPGTRQLPWTR